LRKLNLARSSKNKIHISGIEIGSNRSRARTIANGRHRIGAKNINAYLVEQLMRASHFLVEAVGSIKNQRIGGWSISSFGIRAWRMKLGKE
jgi:hypothetical protein